MKSDLVDQEQKLPDYASLSIVLKVQKRVKKNGYSVQFLHDTTLFALLNFSYFCTVKRRAMLPKVCLKKNSLRFSFDNGCLEGIIISYLQYTVCTVGISERRLQPLVRLVTATFYCATQSSHEYMRYRMEIYQYIMRHRITPTLLKCILRGTLMTVRNFVTTAVKLHAKPRT